jgi:restriction system protein
MELAMVIPWWVAMPLAVVAYFGLHRLSLMPVATASSVADMGPVYVTTVLKFGGAVGQYIVPLILAIGSLVGTVKRAKRKSIYDAIKADTASDKMHSLSWAQFEDLVHQYFLERGYKVTATKEGPDGGVDLRLAKNGRRTTVQAKHWRSRNVGVTVIREQFGIMKAELADDCFIVTSGDFTQEARKWAAGKPINLIDGEALRYLLKLTAWDHLQEKNVGSAPSPPPKPVTSPASPSKDCPLCGSPMVQRTARRGKHAGVRFLGCSRYPRCRGMRKEA